MFFAQLITKNLSTGVILFTLVAYFFSKPFASMAFLTSYLLGFVMFAMALNLSTSDFIAIAKKPLLVLLALVLQYTIMPILAIFISFIFNLDLVFMIGMVLVGSCPGGTASNVLSYLAKGDVALSVSITLISTLLSPFVTPFLIKLLVGQVIYVDAYGMMLDIAKIIFLPMFLGILCNKYFNQQLKSLKNYIPMLSSLTIMLIIAIVVAISVKSLKLNNLVLIGAISLYIILALAISFFICYIIFKLNAKYAKTISIETAVQNSGMAAILAINYFNPLSAIVAALFSVLQNVISSYIISHANKVNFVR